MSLFTLFRKKPLFHGLCGKSWELVLGEDIFKLVYLNKLVQTVAPKKNKNNHFQNRNYIPKLYWENYPSFNLIW